MVVDVYAKKLEAIKEDANLSRQEVAQIVGTTPRTVIRWATRQAVPRGTARERLLELAAISQFASRVMAPEEIGAWLFEPNPLLQFDRPVDLIAKGKYREVMGALQAIGEGVFV